MTEFTEKDIIALDYIIDRIDQGFLQVNYGDLVKAKILKFSKNEDGDKDYMKITNEFERLMHIIESYDCAYCRFDEESDDIGSYVSPNSKTSYFKVSGGFKKAYSDLLEEKEHAKVLKIKERNESKLSSWQVKTFWPLFFFGLFGGIYSAYDFFKNIEQKEEVVTKQEMQSEILKLHNSVLKEIKKDSIRVKK